MLLLRMKDSPRKRLWEVSNPELGTLRDNTRHRMTLVDILEKDRQKVRSRPGPTDDRPSHRPNHHVPLYELDELKVDYHTMKVLPSNSNVLSTTPCTLEDIRKARRRAGISRQTGRACCRSACPSCRDSQRSVSRGRSTAERTTVLSPTPRDLRSCGHHVHGQSLLINIRTFSTKFSHELSHKANLSR